MPSTKKLPGNLRQAERFGIKSVAQFNQLKDRPVRVEIYIGPLPEKNLLPLTVKQREDFSGSWHQRVYDRLHRKFHMRRSHRKSHYGTHTNFLTTLPGRDIPKLAYEKHLQSITILGVAGRRIKKKAKPHDVLSWYFVKALVSRQVEDQTRGMQTYDEQVWLIRAHDEKEAELRFRKKFNSWHQPRFYRDLRFIRWQVEKILMIGSSFFDPDGLGLQLEVSWGLKDRRMRPEYEWHPRRELLQKRAKK